jgi:cysteinyl-tRNA synthetase
MLQFGEEKMAKSVGNVRQLADVIDEHGRDTLVMLFVLTHYRQPLTFSDSTLLQAEFNVKKAREVALRLTEGDPPADLGPHAERFWDALADDFNTPLAWAAMARWITAANSHLDAGKAFGPGDYREMLWAFGLENLLEREAADAAAEALLQKRQEARAAKDFAAADAIRDELLALGWVVRDTPDGAKLVPKE